MLKYHRFPLSELTLQNLDYLFNHFEKDKKKRLGPFLHFHAVIIGITTDIQTI